MMMINCLEASRLASKSLEQDLSLGDRIRLAVHLMMCKECRLYDEQIRVIHRTGRSIFEDLQLHLDGPVGLSPEARNRISSALDEALAP